MAYRRPKPRPRRRYFPPIPTAEISTIERRDLIRRGWRVYKAPDGTEFIVPRRGVRYSPPRLESQIPVERLPRVTYGFDPDGKRIDLVAWDYQTRTVQDLDGPFITPGKYRQIPKAFKPDYVSRLAPRTLRDFPRVTGYVWTDGGLHVIQEGRHPVSPQADQEYERRSREERGWYGERVRSKGTLTTTEGTPRVLVTTSEQDAEVWIQAGGVARLVSDIYKSYSVSRSRREL